MFRILFALVLITLVSCEKHTNKPDEKKLEALLTNGKWLLVAYGYDDNKNGIVDADENLIMDCQKDNTTEYRSNGTGVSLENQSACISDPVTEFEWKFIDNEKAIEIQFQRLDIKTLTDTDLQFIIQVPYISPALITVYKNQ
jgi:hypothetical protein